MISSRPVQRFSGGEVEVNHKCSSVFTIVNQLDSRLNFVIMTQVPSPRGANTRPAIPSGQHTTTNHCHTQHDLSAAPDTKSSSQLRLSCYNGSIDPQGSLEVRFDAVPLRSGAHQVCATQPPHPSPP